MSEKAKTERPIYCYHSFSGTSVRKCDNKRVPIIGVTSPIEDIQYCYPFESTTEARGFCEDLKEICDRLDKEEQS